MVLHLRFQVKLMWRFCRSYKTPMALLPLLVRCLVSLHWNLVALEHYKPRSLLALCAADHHGSHSSKRKPCPRNPNCLFGLGERRRGIWENKPRHVALLGSDPADDIRNVEAQQAGLRNLGATCYLNSLMQCLFMNLPFRAAVFAWRPATASIAAPGTSQRSTAADGAATRGISAEDITEDISTLQGLFAAMQAGIASVADPGAFVRRFGIQAGVQQDAQEFSKVWRSWRGHVLAVMSRLLWLPAGAALALRHCVLEVSAPACGAAGGHPRAVQRPRPVHVRATRLTPAPLPSPERMPCPAALQDAL